MTPPLPSVSTARSSSRGPGLRRSGSHNVDPSWGRRRPPSRGEAFLPQLPSITSRQSGPNSLHRALLQQLSTILNCLCPQEADLLSVCRARLCFCCLHEIWYT